MASFDSREGQSLFINYLILIVLLLILWVLYVGRLIKVTASDESDDVYKNHFEQQLFKTRFARDNEVPVVVTAGRCAWSQQNLDPPSSSHPVGTSSHSENACGDVDPHIRSLMRRQLSR